MKASSQSTLALLPLACHGPDPGARARQARPSPKQARLPQPPSKAVKKTPHPDEDTRRPNRLTPGELEVAERVHIGRDALRTGQSVNITPASREGFFDVSTKAMRF
jgi:hypothetical protein